MIPAAWRTPILFIGVLLVVHAGVLVWFGQPLVSETGKLMLWVGDQWSIEMSQQFFDWYTFSHIIHGFLFYLLSWLLFPRVPHAWRLVMAVGVEAAWEITENTPWLINLYRQQALSVGYVGDSILNSLLDNASMALGFVLAWKLPVRVTVLLAIAMEVWVGVTIRDNLVLNVLNFIYQFDAVNAWQSAGRS